MKALIRIFKGGVKNLSMIIESEPNEGTRILLQFGHSELPSQKTNKKPILVSPPTPNLLP